MSDIASSLITLDIAVEAGPWSAVADMDALARRVCRQVLAGRAVFMDVPVEISLLLTDDAAVQALNRDYRGKNKATNILSFPGVEPEELDAVAALARAGGPPLMLGDMALAWQTVWQEAEAQGKTQQDHLTHLLVHGFLHLLGYDHIEDDEAEEMEALERTLLAHFEIKDPYANTLSPANTSNEAGSVS